MKKSSSVRHATDVWCVKGSVAAQLEDSGKILVSCTKGILIETLETVDEILHRILPSSFHSRLSYLSGPSFAKEVAQEAPTVVTIASIVCPAAFGDIKQARRI